MYQFFQLTIELSFPVHENRTTSLTKKDEIAVGFAQCLTSVLTNIMHRHCKDSYFFHLHVVPEQSRVPGEIVQMTTQSLHRFAQLVEKASIPPPHLEKISIFLTANR